MQPRRILHRNPQSTHWVVALFLGSVVVIGCGKAERYQVESAVLSSIYEEPGFFDTLCGFAVKSAPSPRVQIIDVEGDAQPWLGLFAHRPMPGTASIRLVDAIKVGEDSKQTCEARIGFQWTQIDKPVTDRRHKVGETSAEFRAQGFKKL